MMKWWVAVTAGAALILASVSVWLGFGANAWVIEAQILGFVSTLIAALAAGLGVIEALRHGRRNRAINLSMLVFIAAVLSDLHWIIGLDQALRPFCNQLNENGVCAQHAPLWVDIFDFAPFFALAIAALLSTFWPSKQNPVIAAGQAVWPPR